MRRNSTSTTTIPLETTSTTSRNNLISTTTTTTTISTTTTSTATTTTLTSTTTTTLPPCPTDYLQDDEADVLCDFWDQLQNLRLGSVVAEDFFPGVSPLLVLCPFRNHATSSVLLCQLWCEIQTFSNKVMTANNTSSFYTKYS